MAEILVRIVMHKHITNSVYHSKGIISDLYTTGLNDPSVVIIKNRYAFNLNYSPIIIILYKRAIVITGIKAVVDMRRDPVEVASRIKEEIKLTIGKNGKFDPSFYENIGVSVIAALKVHLGCCRSSFSRKSNYQ
jgi:hypothetical protein